MDAVLCTAMAHGDDVVRSVKEHRRILLLASRMCILLLAQVNELLTNNPCCSPFKLSPLLLLTPFVRSAGCRGAGLGLGGGGGWGGRSCFCLAAEPSIAAQVGDQLRCVA